MNDIIDKALQNSSQAFESYKMVSGHKRAAFLESIADEIEAIGDPLLEVASAESNLPLARFKGERGRTCGQLRMFAKLLREGSWCEATIDKALPDRTPMPRVDLRRMLIPIGPVAVFGASNFPLAFSTAGGDTASALASGCTVVYKEHPAHPATSKMVAEAIERAIQKHNLSPGIFQHISGGIEIGKELVTHPDLKAVAFTGSYAGGKSIFDAASSRPIPIPVFAEMGSINPVFIFPKKIEQEQEELAKQIASSVSLGVGQFCTNPGLILIPEISANEFLISIKSEFEKLEPAQMLHQGIADNYRKKLDAQMAQKGVSLIYINQNGNSLSAAPAIAKVDAETWLQSPQLHEEVFGPSTLAVIYKNEAQLAEIAGKLQGQLTCSIWATNDELIANAQLAIILREKCGRLLFAGAPTGVEVGFAMTHGGPFPSTTDSRSTSVGTYAIKRFARPVTWQSCPQELLPEELKDTNTLKIWRTIEGELSKEDI